MPGAVAQIEDVSTGNALAGDVLAGDVLAETLLAQGRLEEALTACRAAVERGRAAPQPATYVTAGRVLSEMGRHDEAVAAFSSAVALGTTDAEAYVGLALILEDQGKPLDALAAYQKALALRPGDARVYNNVAGILIRQRQYERALQNARAATALAPDHPGPCLNLAAALKHTGRLAECLAAYERLLALQPDHGEALVEYCHQRQHACAWDGLDAWHARARAHSYREGRLASPFAIVTASASAQEQRLCADVWGRRFAALPTFGPFPARPAGRRIRVGYLSADFHRHATAMLIADLIEQHDGARFELFAYSLGADDGSALRRRLASAFHHFTDLADMSDLEAAGRIYADGVDILLDLKGYTQGARVAILAHRPAPVQVNYLGFPGTMGAPFIDYIVADARVAPFAYAAHYAEAIVHLPHCYQPNDRLRTAEAPPGRAALGLPANGFVFCSFNAAYKITPAAFGTWMGLLAAAPGSVLWLLETNELATANLQAEARRRGIAAERLVFAPFVAAERHLARLAHADLFLDTWPVNAHTTASEALWAGLPLVTCAGETFASRVAASLLHAVGLPDCVTESQEAYAALALGLARDPARLAAIRERLTAARATAPLFDTPRYARNLEAAFATMLARHDAGAPPRAFAVRDGAP